MGSPPRSWRSSVGSFGEGFAFALPLFSLALGEDSFSTMYVLNFFEQCRHDLNGVKSVGLSLCRSRSHTMRPRSKPVRVNGGEDLFRQ